MIQSLSSYQSLQSSNPILFNHLVEHPSLQAVQAYLLLKENEYLTLSHVAELLNNSGFTPTEIEEAFNIYMKF